MNYGPGLGYTEMGWRNSLPDQQVMMGFNGSP